MEEKITQSFSICQDLIIKVDEDEDTRRHFR